MNKYTLMFAAAMLSALPPLSDVGAQTKSLINSPGGRAAEKPFVSEQMALETPTGTLHGTLERPQTPSPVPVALIIAGSGPTDRDGNSAMLKGANNSLKLLASGLAAQGIASLRYDKRGIAASAGKGMLNEADLSFETYIDDAILWGRKLRADRRFSSLTVIGHSEGSLIGMVAARKIGADAFVSLAGAGRPVRQIILEQVKPQLSPELFKTTEDILNRLAAGATVESVPPALYVLFRPSIQPYMISWLRYDPAKELAALSVPMLIAQGTTDIQATPEDAKLLARANPAARLLMVEGMNHVLKAVPAEREKQIASYGDPSLPVVPGLVKEIGATICRARPSRTRKR
jgi:pimeloyl-ACP methyl ester carboxylesterase